MKKALFLDRDGVINIEKDYLYKIEDFVFIDGIFDLCHYYIEQDYLIFVVTNQSGIARGYYSEDDFNKLTLWMLQEFESRGIKISKVYFCPHYPEINGECECRKPRAKMLLDAKESFNLDMPHSLLVGDKERDIEAALNAGITETYLFIENEYNVNTKATKIVHNLYEIWK